MLYFALGLLALGAAQGSPLAGLADGHLFSARILQYVIETFVAPPLLLLGLPAWLARPAFGLPLLGPLIRQATRPVTALLVFNLAFAFALFPAAIEAGLHSGAVDAAEQALLFLTALAMWWPIVSPLPERPPISEPGQLVYLFAQLVLETIVFALVAFAPHPLYPTYAAAAHPWGMTALDDQQLGGGIMKVVVLAALAPFIATAFRRWVRREADEPMRPETRAEVAARYRAAHQRSRAAARQPARRERNGLRLVHPSRPAGNPSPEERFDR